MSHFNDLSDWSNRILKGSGKPPRGFTAIPGGSKGGYRKPKPGGGWLYWYADGSTTPKMQDRIAGGDVRRYEPPKKEKKSKKGGDAAKPAKENPYAPIMASLAQYEPNRPIPDNAINVVVHFKPGDDPGKRALVTWNVPGKKAAQRSYSAEFDRRQALVKWNRIAQLMPALDAGTAKLRSMIDNGKTRKDRDAAAVSALMQATGLRPGSRGAAAREEGATYGATTLRPEHVTFSGGAAHIEFIGKSSKTNTRTITDPQLVAALKQRVADPTPEGFLFAATERDSSAAVKAAFGKFKQKDLRTVVATLLGADGLAKTPVPEMTGDAKKDIDKIQKAVDKVSEAVSEYLDHSISMARTSYIPPALFAEWLRGNDIAGGYVKDLFKGKDKYAAMGLFLPISDAGRDLLNRAIERTPRVDVEDIPHEGDTDSEYENEAWPIYMHRTTQGSKKAD
jgi:DNA topoisomerase IB